MASITTQHIGSLDNLPETVTRGLKFLSGLLPALDSLSPDQGKHLAPFMHKNSKIIINGSEPATFESVLPMFEQRSKGLTIFRREVKKAWDIPGEGEKRTVMYESTSISVFKMDSDAKEIRVEEFNVVELDYMGGGNQGLGVVESKVWMDKTPIMERITQLGMGKKAE